MTEHLRDAEMHNLHNYENVYSDEKEDEVNPRQNQRRFPVYENVRNAFNNNENEDSEPAPLVINQLNGSPRSVSRSRKRQFLLGIMNGSESSSKSEERKGRSSSKGKRNTERSDHSTSSSNMFMSKNPLYRSKAASVPRCETP